ncbi:MAG TPA: VWA domain-containing protein [Firmicutes bacterium]|nr:VWA domain-containing protein [Bacillota bacterium]
MGTGRSTASGFGGSGTGSGVTAAAAAAEGMGKPVPDTGWRHLLQSGLRWFRLSRFIPGGRTGHRDRARPAQSPGIRPARRAAQRTEQKVSPDLPATVREASLSAPATGRFIIRPEHLRWSAPPAPLRIDRCLLLDASASMAGERAEACARMAEFLLRNGGGRMAVVAFQGQQGRVLAGFTRSRSRLRQALAGLRRSGLTPLASGLALGLKLVREGRASPVQVILLTDGEPTKALWTSDSVADAFRAAALYRKWRVPLICCGLSGNERVLAGLARESGGSFYVLRDFSAPSLLAVSRRLLGRISAGAAEPVSRTGRGPQGCP